MHMIRHQTEDGTRKGVTKSSMGEYLTKLVVNDRNKPSGLALLNGHHPMNVRLSTIETWVKPWQSVTCLVSHNQYSQLDFVPFVRKQIRNRPLGGSRLHYIPVARPVATCRQTVEAYLAAPNLLRAPPPLGSGWLRFSPSPVATCRQTVEAYLATPNHRLAADGYMGW